MLKDILRWTTLAGLFALPVIIPFIVSASMFFPYITGKNFTFRIIVEIIFAAWVLLALLDAQYRPRFSWILGALALFVVVIGIADVQGANVFKSFWSNFERMEGYLAILHLFMYFVVASAVLNSEKLWRAFWYSSLGASVVIAFMGVQPVISALLQGTPGLPRADASFGNPIYLAIYALFHAFIAAVLMAQWHGTRWHQVILGAVAVLHVVVIVLTQTRGTLIGLVGGAMVTTLLIALFERQHAWLRKLSIGALVALVVLVGGVYAMKDTELAQENQIVNRFTQYDLAGGTIRARFMNWGMAWEGVKERPLLGWGQGNYEYVFSKYYNPDMYAQEPWFDRTHDIIFDWLVAGGFLGLIAYLLIPIALLGHLWANDPNERATLKRMLTFRGVRALFARREHTFSVVERALWTGLLAAYMFHNLFVFDNILSYILYFSVLAYLHTRLTRGNEPLFEKTIVSRETVTSVGLPVVLVVLVIVVWYVNIIGIRTSQILLTALIPGRSTPEQVVQLYRDALAYDQLGRQEVREQLVQAAANMQRTEGVNPETVTEFNELAVTEMKKEVERNPNSARLRLFLGSLYSGQGRYDDAVQEFTEAVALTPTKQNALFQLGQAHLARGNNEQALIQFKKAFELQPEYDEARKLYALALVRAGKAKEAVDVLTEKYGTAAIDDPRLLQAWIEAKRFDVVVLILEARAEAKPDDVQTLVSLAAAYKELGDKAKAITILNQIAANHPEHKAQIDSFIKEIRGY